MIEFIFIIIILLGVWTCIKISDKGKKECEHIWRYKDMALDYNFAGRILRENFIIKCDVCKEKQQISQRKYREMRYLKLIKDKEK